MHGMICKALEGYLRGVHGSGPWDDVRRAAGLEVETFETLSHYPDEVWGRIVAASAARLGIARDALLEDLGTWLCTDPGMEPVRRLMRFSGPSYVEFLYSLDEMHDRARMAVRELDLPVVRIADGAGGRLRLATAWHAAGAGAVITGILRAMADDYGALALIDHEGAEERGGLWRERLSVTIVDVGFAPARSFQLAGAPARAAAAQAALP
jgi:hypothetical protein